MASSSVEMIGNRIDGVWTLKVTVWGARKATVWGPTDSYLSEKVSGSSFMEVATKAEEAIEKLTVRLLEEKTSTKAVLYRSSNV